MEDELPSGGNLMGAQRIDTRHAAKTLAVSSWRRDYEQNPKLRHDAFKAETTTLFEALKREIAELAGLLHDEQALNCPGEGTIRLTEGERGERIVDCYINVANIGEVGVQYLPRIGSERSETFSMIRNGKHDYGWIHGSQNLSSGELASLIVRQILEAGNEVVAYTVKHNPKLHRLDNA